MLDARQLEALAAVVDHGGFGPAAQSLSLSLAAVSLRIKSLEDTLGQRLLVRGKQVRATPAGQALLAHVKQVRLMEADLLDGLQGGARPRGGVRWQSLWVAHQRRLGGQLVPARRGRSAAKPPPAAGHGDRRPGPHPRRAQKRRRDGLRDHARRAPCAAAWPNRWASCATAAWPHPAVAQRCRTPAGAVSAHRLLAHPAIIFNRKDALQDTFLEQHFGLQQPRYPRHFAPAIDAFETAIKLGLGWGMVPEQHLASRPGMVEVLPGATVDVALYWQHWAREAPSAQRLTQAVKDAAGQKPAPAAPHQAR